MEITEKEFYFVLKDIAVSLREIAYALKRSNGVGTEHKVKDTIRSLDSDLSRETAASDADEDEVIRSIVSEKSDVRELAMYRKKIKRPNRPMKKKTTALPKPSQTDSVESTSTPSVSAHAVNPDSDFD